MLLKQLDIPFDNPDVMTSAMGVHIGDKLRITTHMSSDVYIPWVNPLSGTPKACQLSGPDFMLRDAMSVSGGVDLMVEDCGTHARWRMHFVVPDSETDKLVFNEVRDCGVSAADIRRDEWLRDVFS